MPQLEFLGATGTVTGSKYLLTANGKSYLIDCGLFQGSKDLQDRNWNPFPVDVNQIDGVLVTHAHLDHTGYLPRLAEMGYRRKIYCTPSTSEMLQIMLLDSAHLQEEEAHYHSSVRGCCPNAKPLYGVQGAMQALHQISEVGWGQTLDLGEITAQFMLSGHILGAAFIRVTVKENGKQTVILFTGDMGRYGSPIVKDPSAVSSADYVLLESTYGDREHGSKTRQDAILPAVQLCLKNSGCLLIPAFTVGRTQEILYTLRELFDAQKIPSIPVFVDSPMAIDMTHLYAAHHEEHNMDMEAMEKSGHSPFQFPSLKYVRTVEESKALNSRKGPMVIISANGMATGGRITHHLLHHLPEPSAVLLFVGYQAEGTRGRALLDGAKTVKFYHTDIPVNATIMQADNFSAHGDFTEIVKWLSGFQSPPRKIFLVHGEPPATLALQGHIREKYRSWNVEIPKELDIDYLPPQ